jgi:hypothetical protein
MKFHKISRKANKFLLIFAFCKNEKRGFRCNPILEAPLWMLDIYRVGRKSVHYYIQQPRQPFGGQAGAARPLRCYL